MSQADLPQIVHLVPHTHWDREWYRPFQAFRMQLVDMVDRVLEMLENDPDFAFTLDGQLATIDDYLEIRPEAEERIRRLVSAGRLAIGPWQILMDEFLVSGETIVRNLERGWRRADELGGPMRVGYLPDMFGHIAQMPQILARAGLTDAVVWRGVPLAIERHAFRWTAPDGSAVRAEYLPAGYGNAASLFEAPGRLAGRLERFTNAMRPFFGDDPMLAMYGTDHTAPVPALPTLARTMNVLEGAMRVRIGTLADYIAAASLVDGQMAAWQGELRASARANLLMGVTSTRIDLKAACGRAERLLERYAEPFQALWVAPAAWPTRFLSLAWRRVIENSAHDSICGCSVDPVVDQVLVRYAEAEQVARSLARRAAAAAASEVGRHAWVALNPSPTARVGLIEVDLAIPESWDSVSMEGPDGERRVTQELERRPTLLFEREMRGDQHADLFRRFHGREVFDRAWNGYRVEDRGGRPVLILEVDDVPDPADADTTQLRAEAEAAMAAQPDAIWLIRIEARARRRLLVACPAPALGWTAACPVAGAGSVADAVHVDPDGRLLRNSFLRVAIAADGTLELKAADGTRLAGVGRLVDGGDFGDSYNYAPPAEDTLVESPTSLELQVVEDGPLRGRVEVRRRFLWPRAVRADGSARSPETVVTDVLMQVELQTGEPFVRISVALENHAADHRLRFHVPLARSAQVSHAEGQFAVVERGLTAEGSYGEVALPTFPARGWVDTGGVAILLNHVMEYELLADGRRASELALTILRATGLISRDANPYREDPAGPQVAIPGAQCRGPWRVAFALYPHANDWLRSNVAGMAELYQHPFLATPGSRPDGHEEPAAWPSDLPRAGLELSGQGVALSALRRREDEWLELRVVNLTSRPVTATVRGNLLGARTSDLLGRAGRSISLTPDGGLELDLGPAEIRTCHLQRRETASGPSGAPNSGGSRRNE